MSKNKITISPGVTLVRGKGIWRSLRFRENPLDAFKGKPNYINKGFMYMNSSLTHDYFKHPDTKVRVSFPILPFYKRIIFKIKYFLNYYDDFKE